MKRFEKKIVSLQMFIGKVVCTFTLRMFQITSHIFLDQNFTLPLRLILSPRITGYEHVIIFVK